MGVTWLLSEPELLKVMSNCIKPFEVKYYIFLDWSKEGQVLDSFALDRPLHSIQGGVPNIISPCCSDSTRTFV